MDCAGGRVRRAHHVFPVPWRGNPTTIPGSCLPGKSGKITASVDFLWCARRTLPQMEPCCWGLQPYCTSISQPMGYTAAVWPVPAPNRGAVLKIMINQQDGLSVRWGAPCAPCFYGAMAWESDNHPWLMLAGKIGEKCSVGGFFFGAHGAPYRRWSGSAGVAAFCTLISQSHGVHGSGMAGTCA